MPKKKKKNFKKKKKKKTQKKKKKKDKKKKRRRRGILFVRCFVGISCSSRFFLMGELNSLFGW
jgi:hypothetical protein